MSAQPIEQAGALRVLFIEEHFYPHTGGVCVHILNLAKRLIENGATCATLTFRESPSLASSETHIGIRIYRMPSLLHAVRFLAVHRREFDLVHAHTSRRPKTALCMLAAKFYRYPLLFTPHAYYPPRSLVNALVKAAYDRSLGRWSIRSADCVINLTTADLGDGLVRGQRRERSTIIPNSIDYRSITSYEPKVSFRSRYGLGSFLLYVGRITRIKNVEWLVRALPFIQPDLTLAVIGPDDGEQGRLQQLSATLGVSHRILWAGRVKFDELISAYHECDAVVLPSQHEGLPTVLLEAMALAKPVIASPKGGTQALITEGETGFFCGDDPTHLRELLEALPSANRNNRMGEAARRLVEQNYSWDRNVRKVLELYRSVISARASRRRLSFG